MVDVLHVWIFQWPLLIRQIFEGGGLDEDRIEVTDCNQTFEEMLNSSAALYRPDVALVSDSSISSDSIRRFLTKRPSSRIVALDDEHRTVTVHYRVLPDAGHGWASDPSLMIASETTENFDRKTLIAIVRGHGLGH